MVDCVHYICIIIPPCVRMCGCVSMNACTCAFIAAREPMYACMMHTHTHKVREIHIRVHTCVHIHTATQANIHTQLHYGRQEYECVQANMHAYTHIDTHIPTGIHIARQSYHTHVQPVIHICRQAYTHTHT